MERNTDLSSQVCEALIGLQSCSGLGLLLHQPIMRVCEERCGRRGGVAGVMYVGQYRSDGSPTPSHPPRRERLITRRFATSRSCRWCVVAATCLLPPALAFLRRVLPTLTPLLGELFHF
ncbi:hypothetical protein Pcinc_029680 [Petrolisthes cinctipes]|uniref:Uncharacterized protein n=1 Tax=Petrolisthes cinctipes TaxID=88211 RepID=A0AAE1EZU1_PETCI|nr:hypothetical protein Pcinc_029680 [Petrolisthes cinctipes]